MTAQNEILKHRKSWWHSLRDDQRGFVISSETILIAVMLAIGLMAGASSVRDSVISELSDVSGSFQDINQSYTINGVEGHSSNSAGMNNIDESDHCDDADDVDGQADNCIQFDANPLNEGETYQVSTEELVVELLFNGNGSDTSPNGSDNSLTLENGATVLNGDLILDGIDDKASLGSSTDINTGTFFERTIHVEFTPDDVIDRQVVYKEGAGARGIDIYIENGMVYVGAWNIPETNFQPTFIGAPISAGQPISVTFVLDAGPGITPDGMKMYVNGVLIGTAPASELYSHLNGVLGCASHNIYYNGGGSGSGFAFGGAIHQFMLYNRALSDSEVGGL